jgi:hypothetical protein
MTRVFPILATAATVAFLTFGGAAAFAAAVGGHSPGGPAGPGGSAAGGKGPPPQGHSCILRADQLGLEGPAQRAFLSRCERGDAV